MKAFSPVIMIVDDDIELLNGMSRYFSKKGFIVIKANCVPDALTRLHKTIDVILSDYNMKGMNGADLCDIVKKTYNIPIIGITGAYWIDPHTLMKKFDRVIQKPVRWRQVLSNVEVIIRTPPWSLS